MAGTSVQPNRGAEQIKRLLASPEVSTLIADLDATRWTGRPGYPIRTMVGMALVKSLYVLPTWTRTVRLVAEHAALRKAIGGAPSVDACYRFTRKLREHKGALDSCIANVLASLRDELPGFGEHIAIDGSDLPAYANGQRYVSKGGKLRERFSDPDASWGHRSAISTRKGGGFYGYKIHAAVCTVTGLPVAWETRTARDAEVP
ncbi:MAG: transposase, partial [Actinobacteria bacterium]|nr:transposase [Actinomycetota bacterium]